MCEKNRNLADQFAFEKQSNKSKIQRQLIKRLNNK